MNTIEEEMLKRSYEAFVKDPSDENCEDLTTILQLIRQPALHHDIEKSLIHLHKAEHTANADARKYLLEAKKLIEQLKEPPRFPATLVYWQPRNGVPERATVYHRGALMEVSVITEEVMETLEVGHEVILNHDGTCIIENTARFPRRGEIATFDRFLEDGRMVLVRPPDTHMVVEAVAGLDPKPGEECLINEAGICFEIIQKKKPAARSFIPTVRFSDIGGLDEQIARLVKLCIWPLMFPEESRLYGQTMPKGVIVIGSPGTGKTLTIEALSAEVHMFLTGCGLADGDDPGRHFITVKASDIRSKWYGDSERAVAQLIREARQLADDTHVPSIVYIDEIEGLLRNRESDTITSSVNIDVLLSFLTELDGLEECEGKVILIGSTNKLSHIDPSMLRSGRIDHVIVFPRPDRVSARDIFRVHFSRIPYFTHNGTRSAILDQLIEAALGRIYARTGQDNILAHLTFADGTKRHIRAFELFNGAEAREIVKRTAARSWERVIEARMPAPDPAKQDAEHGDSAEVEWRREVNTDITVDDLFMAIDERFAEMSEPLSAENVKSYIDLRDDLRVVSLEKRAPNSLASKYFTNN